MSTAIRDQFVNRLLAVMRGEDCMCSEVTCDSCIARLIEYENWYLADIALSRIEQAISGATQPQPQRKDEP